jgi:DNA polymerase-1
MGKIYGAVMEFGGLCSGAQKGTIENMDHLVLLDGHHLLYRAYWAIPRTLKTRSGEQTNTVFGMASMLLNILSVERPDALLICFDEGSETFRHVEHEEYKDGRAETPDDFYEQIPRVLELIDAFGIRHISDSRYEADDFLCTYARAGEAADMRTTIVTGDRDALQIATDKIRVAIPHKGYQQTEYLGPNEIETKYGVRPDQVTSYKGLCGDSSDNLPGVKGIGPKGAASLLQKYDSLEGVYNHLDEIKPVLREKLEHDKGQAFFCERMAELLCDIPLPISLDDLWLKELSSLSISEFFQKMEFSLLVKRLQSLVSTEFGTRFTDGEDLVFKEKEKKESQLSLFSD